ncbi:MAG: shikimate kinase [Oceanicoccus sp.]|uniref:shikimate kinase n=1 Tax=Oceanicoccus sp. TaxID=2691044 RepID=UPI0026069FDA|nr:shikimate kinase [Oceanicoccus sp.]MCP3908907.1 shikimate kinase [Oceanicoccus sp.]MDG1773891.1 shikimate kinase [Oceanicoccus sp.]
MSSISLIGMPGAGKSTLGVQLAKATARDFVDTDLLIQLREHKPLQQIIDETDYLNLRRIEEETLLAVNDNNHIIATGGSAVYSEAGMAALKKLGPVVFLDVALDELKQRINNYEQRGIARHPEQNFADLFAERNALYRRHADHVIDCAGKTQDELVAMIVEATTAA